MMTIVEKQELREILAQRLINARLRAGHKTRSSAIEKFGWKLGTYRSHEDGSRGFSESFAQRYASAYNVDVKHLLGHDLFDSPNEKTNLQPRNGVSPLPVYGAAAGGSWRDADEYNIDSIETIDALGVANYPLDSQYLRKVVGNSISNRIPDGAYAIFVKAEAYGRIPFGKLVGVRRERAGLCEYSIKVFYGDKLLTDSKQLNEQQELDLKHTDDDTTVYIDGVVVGAHMIL